MSQVSAVANWPARQKSCCRHSLTICAINYSGRASELGGIVNLVDRRQSCLLQSELSLSRAKLITRFDDGYAMAKFSKSRVWSKIPEGSAVIFEGTWTSLKDSVGMVEGSYHAKNQLDSFIRFDRTPTCDRQTDTDGHRAIASSRASIASRGCKSNTTPLTLRQILPSPSRREGTRGLLAGKFNWSVSFANCFLASANTSTE